MTNLDHFFDLWPDIIRATTTPSGVIALLVLSAVALGLILAVRRDAPWYATLILFALLIVAVVGLSSIVSAKHVMTKITASYGLPGNATLYPAEFTKFIADKCENQPACHVAVGHARLHLPDPGPGLVKVTEVAFYCGDQRRLMVLTEDRDQELWCQ